MEAIVRPGYTAMSDAEQREERRFLAIGIAETAQREFMTAAIKCGTWDPRRAAPEDLARLKGLREFAYRDDSPWHGMLPLIFVAPEDAEWVHPKGREVAVVGWETAGELLASASQLQLLDFFCRWPA